jgi:N-acetylglutamate synthase-like GNAT family acetyltransferase
MAADYYEWFLEFMNHDQPFLMARRKGRAIGFVAGEINTGYALMQFLAVDDKHRGFGIGRKLVKAFEKNCFKRGIRYFLLYGHKDRVGFFKRMGYTMGSPCFEFMKVFPETKT